jgi:hypothetical protein
MDLYRI